MIEWDDAIVVGVVARSQGNRGEVAVNAQTDFPEERFRSGASIETRRLDGSRLTLIVDRMRMHLGRPVIHFAGYNSIGDAELLAGLELRVAKDDIAPLPEGEFFHRDLIGCEVVTGDGQAIGEVSGVEGDRQVSRLVVKGQRGEILIPLADEICRVDLAARRIVVTPPEGLLELNGEWR